MNLDWIKELDYTKAFNDDYIEIIELIGIDNFLKLYNHFRKLPLYFTEAPFTRLKSDYIRKHKQGIRDGRLNISQICRRLDVSQRFVYKVLEEANYENYDLFEDQGLGC